MVLLVSVRSALYAVFASVDVVATVVTHVAVAPRVVVLVAAVLIDARLLQLS
jgi:hypothetical protein